MNDLDVIYRNLLAIRLSTIEEMLRGEQDSAEMVSEEFIKLGGVDDSGVQPIRDRINEIKGPYVDSLEELLDRVSEIKRGLER
jgi:hypothetical protein